ncbi:MAG: serine hydrolase domain-containing protein [Saprospiraceae bacterium]
MKRSILLFLQSVLWQVKIARPIAKLSCMVVFLLYHDHAKSQSFEAAIAANDRLISSFVENCKVPGLSMAVIHKGKLVWHKEYGLSHIELGRPVTDSSKFRIASVSKLFTGTAILMLHKSGKLHLDDPVSKYLDFLPLHYEHITIRQIAQHTSGIGHYLDEKDALDLVDYATPQEALGKFVNRPLLHPPDGGVTYSSFAYTVLAAVIEKATGKDFLTAMHDLIFEPFGMYDTEADQQRKIITSRTGFYQYGNKLKWENAQPINLSGRWAGSGFLSTAIDVARFGAFHTALAGFFTKEDLDLLTAPRQINDTLRSVEGLGWGQRTDWEGRMMYWGDGRTPGSTCGLLVFPEHELSIAILTNIRRAPLDRGEFQALCVRLIAAVEKSKIKEIGQEDVGAYQLEININGNSLNGTLDLHSLNGIAGTFDFHNLQKFKVIDMFWKDGSLWVFAVGTGEAPIAVGILPIKLKPEGNFLVGEIFRLGATVKVTKN